GLDRRLDDLDLLAPEQAAFTRVRVEAADGELRRCRSQALERAVGGRYHARDIVARDHLDRLPHAAVQRGVDDFHVAEAQHQVDVALVGAGRARDERRVAVELDAGKRDRRLVLRRGDDRVHLARAREFDRPAGEGERGAAARGAAGTEVERGEVRLRAAEHVDAAVGPVGIAGPCDYAQLGRDGAGGGMPFEQVGVADHDRIAGVAPRGVRRSLEAGLRCHARRIARGNGNSRFVAHAWTPVFYIGGAERMRERPVYSHGMSEAWITSGTPWPPTDLRARSTSLSPNLWVVTFSNGKRFEASCARASSHALKLWPRALLMVMNFTVTFSSGKLGNSFISPWTTMVPPLRLSASTPSRIGMVRAGAVMTSGSTTPLRAVMSMMRASGSSCCRRMVKSAQSSSATATRARSWEVRVTMMTAGPACLQITVCDSPCWP